MTIKSFYLLVFLFLSANIMSQSEVSIQFQSDGLTLNGTLAIPDGQGPFPIAILVHGSGPSNRNQSILINDACIYPMLNGQTIRTFEDLSDHLANQGVAVLRYDKRSLTHGTNPDAEQTVSAFIRDVNEAIKFVQSRSEINDEQIFLIGHSQGAAMIPISAMNTGDVMGLVSLSGSTTPIDSLLAEQFRRQAAECTSGGLSLGNDLADQLYVQFRAIRRGNFPLDETVKLNFPNGAVLQLAVGSFWKDWFDNSDDVIENYQMAGEKVLILHGEDDWNVDHSDSEQLFRELSGLPAKLMTYPGINHFLTTSTDPSVDQDILSAISEWILGCVTSTVEERDDTFTWSLKGDYIHLENLPANALEEILVYNVRGQHVQTTKIVHGEALIPRVGTYGLLTVVIPTSQGWISGKVLSL